MLVFDKLEPRKFHCRSRMGDVAHIGKLYPYPECARVILCTLLDMCIILVWAFISEFNCKGHPRTSILGRAKWMPTFLYRVNNKTHWVS